MTHVTCRLTVKNRDQLRNPTLGNRVWATFLPCMLFSCTVENVKQRSDVCPSDRLSLVFCFFFSTANVVQLWLICDFSTRLAYFSLRTDMVIFISPWMVAHNNLLYTNRRSEAQRKLMPYAAGYGLGRARPMGPLQRLGRNFAICL